MPNYSSPKNQRYLKSGSGWRVGWDTHAATYPGLVGADEWAVELTEVEFQDFNRLFRQLHQTMKLMAQELMEEEQITCEVETDLLWLEAQGYPHSYSLRLILNQGRRCEGNWSPEAVPELFIALERLTIF